MRSQARFLPLFLLLRFLLLAAAQRQSLWDEPIRFVTKAKDSCGMTVTGAGELTRLRLSCQGGRGSYWCEYVGRPDLCRAYSKNPRHYFVQMMWGLKKLHNACQAPRFIKPHMCRMATDDSQMVFSSASFARPRPEGPRGGVRSGAGAGAEAGTRPPGPGAARQAPRKTVRVPERGGGSPQTPSRSPQTPSRSPQTPSRSPQTPSRPPPPPPPPPPATESPRKQVARRYCWRSLQGLCAFFIGLVRH